MRRSTSLNPHAGRYRDRPKTDFFNNIGMQRTSSSAWPGVAFAPKETESDRGVGVESLWINREWPVCGPHRKIVPRRVVQKGGLFLLV